MLLRYVSSSKSYKRSVKMIVDCISDLHGHYPKLEGGDLLIVAGDLTATHEELEYFKLWIWLDQLNYQRIIVIAGNHDGFLQNGGDLWEDREKIQYLCDSGTEFGGLKIWGSPWTKRFKGMNPHCMAFTCETEEELAEKWALIPDDVDILVTHCPPFHGALYAGQNPCESFDKLDRTVLGEHFGSLSLLKACDPDAGLRLHAFGHIHEGYGHYHEVNPIFTIDVVNASHINEHHWPINKPIRIEL